MDARFNNVGEPPGTFIGEEIAARGWMQRDLAFILGVAEQSVNQIINGKRGISAEMAKALADAFGTSAEVWANLQRAHDLHRARSPDPGVARRGRVQAHYPLREMIKRGWIIDAESSLIETHVARFFEVSSIDEVPHLAHAAKKTSYYEEVPASQLAWLFRVRQIAKSITAPKYSESKLRRALNELSTLRAEPEEVRHVPRILHDAGVRFIIVEGLSGGKIDGVCFWLKSQPVIGMSLRFDRIDNFWFVLRHEIEHILRGHGKAREIIDVDMEVNMENVSDEEALANTAAADFCVPSDKMKSFYLRKHPYFSERDVIGFARRNNVHPGLVVGQIRRMTNRWDFLVRHLAKFRAHILRTAMVDGWGDIAPVDM